MANKKLKIVGITFSITFLMFIALMFFINAMRVIWADFFTQNAVIIAIISGIIVLLGIITGTISIGALTSKGKGFFS